MPTIVVLFIAVFLSAFFLFGVIVLLLSPSMIKGVKKHIRLFTARKSREFRAGADPERMDGEARSLEGTYYFE